VKRVSNIIAEELEEYSVYPTMGNHDTYP